MRILLYGMQSSGASAIAYTMAQRPNCLAFPDIWNMYAAPILETEADVIAKAVVTTAYPLSVHKARFKPDVTILILRHPFENYQSLLPKIYAHESGLPLEKFRLLEKTICDGTEYDHILYYEDFIFTPSSLIDFCKTIGWTLDHDALLYPRSADDIRIFNTENCPAHLGRVKYGLGQYKPIPHRQNQVSFTDPAGKLPQLAKTCPRLLAKYQALRIARGALWHIPQKPLLSCGLDHFVNQALGITQPEQLGITPAPDGSENGVKISGLPGTPFNRLTGVVHLKNPHANNIQAVIRIEDAQGNIIAQQNLRLKHSDMAYFDLSYQSQPAPMTFYLGAIQPDQPGQDSVYFEDLHLDYVPAGEG